MAQHACISYVVQGKTKYFKSFCRRTVIIIYFACFPGIIAAHPLLPTHNAAISATSNSLEESGEHQVFQEEHFTFLPCFTISCTTKQVVEFVKTGLAYVEIILHISNKFQEMMLSIITSSDCSLDCKYTHENGSGSFTTMHFSFSLAADCLTHFEQNDASHFL